MPTLPERLRDGDTVSLVAPGSPPPDPRAVDRGIAAVEGLGFRVKAGRHLRVRRGFLAGTDRDRAGDLMRAFADPSVRAIFCLRGGYGAARLLPLLDYRLIRRNPKIFVGYSDITSLHCALLAKAGLVTFHGPMAVPDMLDFAPAARDLLLATLTQPVAPGPIGRAFAAGKASIIRGGAVEGRLVGGNLSVLCTTVGTPYQPAFAGRILFFEDVDEKPYRLDRMLTHLLNAGLLRQVAGVAVGRCTGCDEAVKRAGGGHRQGLADVLRERLLPLRVPVLAGLPFGHATPNATLPFGGQARLDAGRGELVITRAAVR